MSVKPEVELIFLQLLRWQNTFKVKYLEMVRDTMMVSMGVE